MYTYINVQVFTCMYIYTHIYILMYTSRDGMQLPMVLCHTDPEGTPIQQKVYFQFQCLIFAQLSRTLTQCSLAVLCSSSQPQSSVNHVILTLNNKVLCMKTCRHTYICICLLFFRQSRQHYLINCLFKMCMTLCN